MSQPKRAVTPKRPVQLSLRLLACSLVMLLNGCALLFTPALSFDISSGLQTSLPLVEIETSRTIVDEPKVSATMRVFEDAAQTKVSDYDGFIGIEIRGQTSQRFPKKQYSLETRYPNEKNNNVSLLGLPRENDWILNGPYSDKSLMRNVLAYNFARRSGHYASRTVFVELVINDEYQGVYVLTESIKRDDARVDIDKDGYILELSQYPKLDAGDVYFTAAKIDRPIIFKEPDPEDISDNEREEVARYIAAFESVLHNDSIFQDPEQGYRPYVDMTALVDYVLLHELFKNIDAFDASTYFHLEDEPEDGSKLVFGPAWDFNFSSGNDSLESRRAPESWLLARKHWSTRFFLDPYFVDLFVARWEELKTEGVIDKLFADIDGYEVLLQDAQQRNFERWQVLGTPLMYNPPNYTFDSYAEEVAYLRDWFVQRVDWMDENIEMLKNKTL